MTHDEKLAALRRAADAAPVDDVRGMLAAMLCTFSAILAADAAAARDTSPRQEWARRAQAAAFFGVTPNALDKWLPDLVRRKEVRTLHPPGGWMLYNLRDIERAFSTPGAPCRKP